MRVSARNDMQPGLPAPPGEQNIFYFVQNIFYFVSRGSPHPIRSRAPCLLRIQGFRVKESRVEGLRATEVPRL